MDITHKLDALMASLGPFHADVCGEAAEEIESLRAKLADPGIANLRCLESSVRNLIACLCRHDGSVLRGSIPTTGTIGGDLYATVAAIVGNKWDNDTLSELQRRYPLPRPIAEQEARPCGGGELPDVPREVCDGGRDTVDRRVCGSADVDPPLSYVDAPPSYCGVDMGEPGGDRAEVWYEMPVKAFEAALEQARSTTRRNILKALDHLNGKLPEKWDIPGQDIAVAMVALRQSIKAEHAGDHKASIMERFAFDQMRKAENELKNRELTLRGAIKGRDGKIKALQDQVDRLARHIAFQVAK